MTKNQLNKKLKTLRADNGLEFCNSEFENFCKQKRIVRHRTVRNTPKQNGVAERMNRTLMNKVRCLLISSGLAKGFWAEAVCTVACLINRSPSISVDLKTPQELWTGKPPDLSHIRVFGCVAHAHQTEGRLDPRATKCVLLGYPEGVKGYRLWVLDGKSIKIINSMNVVFNESEMPCLKNRTEK